MLLIVQEYKAHYNTVEKTEKSRITQHVINVIQKNAGDDPAKFLKQRAGKDKDTPYWDELSDKEAHKKVAHTLREHKTRMVKPSIITSLKKKNQVHKGTKRESSSKSTNATHTASCSRSNSFSDIIMIPEAVFQDFDLDFLIESALDDGAEDEVLEFDLDDLELLSSIVGVS
jgi:hypothetical protein